MNRVLERARGVPSARSPAACGKHVSWRTHEWRGEPGRTVTNEIARIAVTAVVTMVRRGVLKVGHGANRNGLHGRPRVAIMMPAPCYGRALSTRKNVRVWKRRSSPAWDVALRDSPTAKLLSSGAWARLCIPWIVFAEIGLAQGLNGGGLSRDYDSGAEKSRLLPTTSDCMGRWPS